MENIIQENIETSMSKNFIDYAMSVIVDRALPDARDGLKPVQLRILFDMAELGLLPDRDFKKCARIVGDTLGKYHAHGDQSVYGALVKLAQEFSKRYPLINGHGNFGSIDADPAAAMRYTEAKLSRIGHLMLQDINKNTVDFVPNFDNSEVEPSVLPSLFPNLLANGSEGIAVGMATNIAPHNISDLYDALIYILDKTLAEESFTIDDLISIVKAPDFPTGGIIVGTSGVKKAYKTGKGPIVVRSKFEVEQNGDKSSIVITELPFQVVKSKLVTSIADLVKNKDLTEVSEIRDESDKSGIRVVIDLKKNANIQLVINKLLKKTKMQDTFSMNTVALVDGRPRELNLQECLEIFLAHAAEVIIKRSQFDLDKSQKRLNLVEGVLRCIETNEAIEWVINVIRTKENPVEVLIEEGELNREQAEYVYDMKLRSISKSSEEKLKQESVELTANIENWTRIVEDEAYLLETMKSEFLTLKQLIGDKRRTAISYDDSEIEEDELIEDEMLVINITVDGIIKAVEEKEYRSQSRGGKGLKNIGKSNEAIKYMLTVNSKDDLLFFTNKGRCHCLKAFKINKSARTSKGRSLNNYLSLEENEWVVNVLTANLKDKVDNHLLFVTKNGIIKRLPMESLSAKFSVTRIMSFKEGDELVEALIVKAEDNIIITTAKGKSIRISMNAEGNKCIRPMGRTAAGVRGININSSDYVVDMVSVHPEKNLITVTENGLGKRTSFEDFSVQGRGGSGIIVHKVNKKTGNLVAATTVQDSDDLFVATKNGLIIRVSASTIRTMGRSTAGVRIINLNEGDEVASISKSAAEAIDEFEESDIS